MKMGQEVLKNYRFPEREVAVNYIRGHMDIEVSDEVSSIRVVLSHGDVNKLIRALFRARQHAYGEGVS